MAESRMSLQPASSSVTFLQKGHYNKALRDLLRRIGDSKSQLEITDEHFDDDLCPVQDSSAHLYTETDVTLPSHLIANTCTEPSFLMSGLAGSKHRMRKPQNTALKSPHVLPSEIHDIYEELSEIYHKLQQERMSQQEYSLQLKKREQSLLEREEMLLKHQATLGKIKDVGENVQEKFRIMKEQHDVEVKQLSDAFKEKIKENKRLKSSFDTLKEMNDTLKKQLNEVIEQNKKLESQAKKVQSRLENLQRKHAFLTVQKSKDTSQIVNLPKPQNVEKRPAPVKPKVLNNMQVFKLVTILMDWLSSSEGNGGRDKSLSMDKLPTNCFQEKCAKVLPVLVEQFQWMPMVSGKLHLSFMRFSYWTLRQLENRTQSTLTSTIRRLGEETFKGVVYHPVEDSMTEERPRSVAFFKSNNFPLRFVSTLVILKTVTQVDYLAQALDSLCMDLKSDEGRTLFLEYHAVPIVVELLHVSNRGLISSVLDILLQLSMETRFLQPFLESCSTESFFCTCAALLKDSRIDVQILEKLSIVLQKLSKVRSNKKLFEIFSIPQVIQELQRTANADHAFLIINLNSILFHLGFAKTKAVSPTASIGH
ncbi:coiled-coil domain-containing protein 138 [Hyla sarda]|uniref:coiled-coil domain-containing protein 138 n=1 Tax=Hyla sarda TaxID=327740 RepID=UPI0024C3268D|nr:coiled-coil domain-containing protein 138 [Hyla sarda]XP_056411999.1 coiled-coil domain-containing protein 138 [Hyla sarda]